MSSCVRTTTAVAASGATCASASSGQSSRISSALGSRSGVAKRGRASADDRPPAEQLRRRAKGLGGVGGAVDEETRRRNGHVGEDRPAFLLEHVTAATAPRGLLEVGVVELRPDVRAGDDGQRHIRLLLVAQRLDEHVDLAAARQSHAERHLVGDAVRDEAWLPAGEHLLRGQDDVALDAAVRDRTGEAAVLADDELRPDRTRGRAAGRDHRGDRDAFSLTHADQSSRARAGYLPRYALRRSSCSRSSAAGPESTTRPVDST